MNATLTAWVDISGDLQKKKKIFSSLEWKKFDCQWDWKAYEEENRSCIDLVSGKEGGKLEVRQQALHGQSFISGCLFPKSSSVVQSSGNSSLVCSLCYVWYKTKLFPSSLNKLWVFLCHPCKLCSSSFAGLLLLQLYWRSKSATTWLFLVSHQVMWTQGDFEEGILLSSGSD